MAEGFEHLPVAGQPVDFEALFATPQAVKIERLCAAHSVGYTRVESWEAFTAAVSATPTEGVRVLEIRTDRKMDRDRFRELVAPQ